MKVIEPIKDAVTNPESEYRQPLFQTAAYSKAVSALSTGFFGAAASLALVSSIAHPIIGGLGLIITGSLAVVSRDIYTTSKNVTTILKDKNDRISFFFSTQRFVEEALKNTWIFGPVASDLLPSWLDNTELDHIDLTFGLV